MIKKLDTVLIHQLWYHFFYYQSFRSKELAEHTRIWIQNRSLEELSEFEFSSGLIWTEHLWCQRGVFSSHSGFFTLIWSYSGLQFDQTLLQFWLNFLSSNRSICDLTLLKGGHQSLIPVWSIEILIDTNETIFSSSSFYSNSGWSNGAKSILLYAPSWCFKARFQFDLNLPKRIFFFCHYLDSNIKSAKSSFSICLEP